MVNNNKISRYTLIRLNPIGYGVASSKVNFAKVASVASYPMMPPLGFPFLVILGPYIGIYASLTFCRARIYNLYPSRKYRKKVRNLLKMKC